MMLRIAGPSRTMNSVGRMNRIIGTVSIAGSRAAFSSARVMRALAEFGGQDAQRLGQRRAEFGGLQQRVHDAADRAQVGAGVQILERLLALGQVGQLGRGDAEFLAELGPGQFELARHADQRGVEAEPRLGADHQQVERVRQAQFHLVLRAS